MKTSTDVFEQTMPIAMMTAPNGHTSFGFHAADKQPENPVQPRPTPPRPTPAHLQHGQPQSASPISIAQRTPQPTQASPEGLQPSPPPAPQPAPPPTLFSPDPRYAQMVSSIVDPNPNPPHPPNLFHLYPPRTRTPPEYSFESDADWLPDDGDAPAAPAAAPRPRGSTDARRPALDLGWGAYHEKGVRGNDEAMRWVAGEICQAEEPIIPQTHYGYTGGPGFRRPES